MAEVQLIAITPDAEKVIEAAGRTCYLSFDHQGQGDTARFISMLIKKGHLSVLEHASATFRVRSASRSFTHQMVRHRLCSFSQQSQRYVDESNCSFVEPDSIRENPEASAVFKRAMDHCLQAYTQLVAAGIPKEDARFVLPNATVSEIVISANFREWRHIFELRCHRRAQWEIRRICSRMLLILQEKAPAVFGDLRVDRRTGVLFSHETR